VDGTSGTASAIAAGFYYSCAIQAGSRAVVCWGDYGPGPPPPSVDGTAGSASAIAVGYYHSCAIQAGSGAVVCWGGGFDGQATPPPSVNGTAGTASAIAAALYYSCAIQAGTGAVICWGNNYYGQATPPPSVDGTSGTASAIAAGGSRTLAILTAAACSDGIDNDGDGVTDYPADPACWSPAATVESAECDDGIDNDGDGGTDWDGTPPEADCLVAWHDDESVTYVPEPSLVLGLGSCVLMLFCLACLRRGHGAKTESAGADAMAR
jgi:hypothetical protein